ncbi:hypothetical protein BU25DRAFT_461732 [Macroventuria anomochaeta]|uniref:Uncharacterized protein n=1 Tax=Macroventuria anomochaeta TaxID=301207 RepID=A0ACB6RNW1_9PLEO|nr:uncharacterized protein BU25DRAFT_461732 [Macroventuria anomochaeta]KAF2623640.1 hypothetical protein BU25DRAFT_461732 [Macroventuria anomochaeta]
MLAKVLVGSALSMSSLAFIVTPSASTSDPTITPGPQIELWRKQNNDRYMGWVSQNGVWTSQQCESGATYFQTGGHWRCCAATSAGCDIPQACVNGNLIFDGRLYGGSTSLTIPCTSAYPDPTDRSFTICNTAFMYENDQDSSPQTNVNCGISSVNWSYYRVQPEAAKTTSRSSTPRSTTAATTSDGNGDTNAATPTLTPTKEEKSSSKAWIAGAVVGPIVGLALIGFLAWFCIRRKKRSTTAAPPPASYNPQPAAPTGPASPPQYFPPPMQQQGAGMVPFGVEESKQNTWTSQPQSPVSQASSPNPLSMYGNQYPQQGGHAGSGQPVYNVPSPSMSPPPHAAQQGAYAENNANYQQPQPHEARPFSSELDGSPQVISVQPKQN